MDHVVVPEDSNSTDSEDDIELNELPTSSADAAVMARSLRSYLYKLPTLESAGVENSLSFMDTVQNFILHSVVKAHQTDRILLEINVNAGTFCQTNFVPL